jgi:DNA-binding MarR family transcriptional regulator
MTGEEKRKSKVESLLQAELRENPGFLLAQSARIMREKLSGALSGTGLSMQELTILRLLSASGPMNQQELGAACNLDKTTVTELIDSLEANGFARREISETDRRSKQIILTASGKRVLAKASKLASQAEEEFIEMFSEREWSTIRKCLARYLDSNDGGGSADGRDGRDGKNRR